jgi:hypothetical protein
MESHRGMSHAWGAWEVATNAPCVVVLALCHARVLMVTNFSPPRCAQHFLEVPILPHYDQRIVYSHAMLAFTGINVYLAMVTLDE